MNVCSKFQFNRSYRQTLLPVTARQKITKRRKQIKPQAQQPRCRFGPGDDFEKTAFSEHLELGGFRAVRETVPVWVKSGSGRGVGRFCPNSGNDLLGTVSDLYKRNPPFSQLLRCKNGGLAGRSVGIRTRGLLDPNQARYQTSPHPDNFAIINKKMLFVKCFTADFCKSSLNVWGGMPGVFSLQFFHIIFGGDTHGLSDSI